MESLELLHLVLANLGARDLAVCCCCCKAWNEVGSSNHLWRALCVQKWPGCEKLLGKKAIEAMGGYKVFYTRRALASMGRTRSIQAKPWLRLEHLTFFVDLTYKGGVVMSEAMPGTVMKGEGLSFGVRIEPSVVTEAVLPRQALTPFFYQGQLYYEGPFQAVHASDYWLNWSAVRSTDHRMACLLHSAPLAASADEMDLPWGRSAAAATSGSGGGGLQRLGLPLLFQGELTASVSSSSSASLLQCHTARLLTRSPFVSFACLDCRPLWGNTLSHPMQFQLVEVHLGVWQRCHSRPPPLDSVLLTLEQLDWK